MTDEFRATARVGRAGEDAIARAYGGVRTKRGEPGDLTGVDLSAFGLGTACTVEVKTDTYDPRRTSCVFLERYTLRPDGSRIDGGPWRAAKEGVDVFVYYYVTDGLTLFTWELRQFVVKLGRTPRYRVRVGTQSAQYRALGHLIPRVELAEVAAPYYATTYTRRRV